MNREEATQITERVFSLYEKFGSADYIGEPVSQIEHMSQAAELAINEGSRPEVVLAAFFHDIGHLFAHESNLDSMGGFGVMIHEKIGADFLRRNGYPEEIAILVGMHVDAKRYLTATDPHYLANLSEASIQTLSIQGGPMTPEEIVLFESIPGFRDGVRLRRWDEMAKAMNVPILDLSNLKELSVQVLMKSEI